jgi:hypothetical protein
MGKGGKVLLVLVPLLFVASAVYAKDPPGQSSDFYRGMTTLSPVDEESVVRYDLPPVKVEVYFSSDGAYLITDTYYICDVTTTSEAHHGAPNSKGKAFNLTMTAQVTELVRDVMLVD